MSNINQSLPDPLSRLVRGEDRARGALVRVKATPLTPARLSTTTRRATLIRDEPVLFYGWSKGRTALISGATKSGMFTSSPAHNGRRYTNAVGYLQNGERQSAQGSVMVKDMTSATTGITDRGTLCLVSRSGIFRRGFTGRLEKALRTRSCSEEARRTVEITDRGIYERCRITSC